MSSYSDQGALRRSFRELECAPGGFRHIHDVISQAEFEDISAHYKQTAGFAVNQVNRRIVAG